MKLENDNDQLMVLAAVRYCLGRQSYIPGVCLRWLAPIWKQIEPNTQALIVRDIVEELMCGNAGDSDATPIWNWKPFAELVWSELDAEQKEWIRQDVAWRDKPWPLEVQGEP